MSMQITEKAIQEAHKRLKPTHGGVWQDAFAVLYLMKEFGLSEANAAAQSAFGGNDYGIDAFHLAADLRNLYLYQFKWTTDARQFASSIQRLTTAGIERVFGNATQDENKNPVLVQLKSVLYEKRAIVDRVFIHCVFRGKIDDAEKSKHLEALQEDLETQRFHIQRFFGREIEFVFEYRSTEGRRSPLKPGKTIHEFALSLNQLAAPHVSPLGHRLHVGFVPLLELHGLYKAMSYRLFERNIRFGLSEENAPNREIRRSLEAMVLKGSDDPEHFAFFHNGVSIAASSLVEANGGWRIVEPRVLNGAQTITSFDHFLNRNERNALLRERQDALASVRVLAKIIVAPPGDPFITRVTINNNRQNPVEPWNLRANDDVQLRYADEILEQLRFVYERQEGAFASLTEDDLDDLGVAASKPLKLLKVAKTLLALQGEVKRMSQLGEVFEQDKTYGATFRSDYLCCDLRDLVVAYKVGECAGSMASCIEERGENKWWFISRARNLLWALGIQAIFNGRDREKLASSYGKDMQISANFRELMRDEASRRLRPIIANIVEAKHMEEVKAGKVSFLGTNAMFDDCMAYARKQYRWDHESFRTRV